MKITSQNKNSVSQMLLHCSKMLFMSNSDDSSAKCCWSKCLHPKLIHITLVYINLSLKSYLKYVHECSCSCLPSLRLFFGLLLVNCCWKTNLTKCHGRDIGPVLYLSTHRMVHQSGYSVLHKIFKTSTTENRNESY